MTENTTNFASLIPDDFSEGGGLPAVGTLCKMEPAFVNFEFTAGKPVPALMVSLTDVNSGEDYGQQYYTVGSPENWEVSADGKSLIPIGGKVIAKSSDVAQFIMAAINAGYPQDRLAAGDITKMSGTVALMGETPALDYKGQQRQKKSKDGKEYAATLIVPVEVKELPNANPNAKKTKATSTAKSAAPATKAAPANAPSPAASSSDAIKDKAVQFILELVSEAGDEGLAKKGLAGKAMIRFKEDADRSNIVMLCGSDEFLGNSDIWSFENGIIKLS